jgi:hypothetical protein
MKYLPLLLLIILAACGPNTSHSSGQHEDSVDNNSAPLQVRPIQGYFVRNTVKQNDSVTCWVISSPEEKDSILAPAKTMTNVVDTFDFANEIVTAVQLRPSDLTQDVQLTSAMVTEDEVHLHFAIRADTPKRSFTAAALWMGAFPRTPDVKSIRFYSGDKLLRTMRVAE